MQQSCHYMIVDAYPKIDGPHFETFAGAMIGCWIAMPNDQPDSVLARELAGEGWAVGRITTRETVTKETYARKRNGRAEFEQAIERGFAAHLHVRHRERMDMHDIPQHARSVRSSYQLFVNRLTDGAYSFLARTRQWANGVTPDGDEFVPLWSADEDARRWQDYWEDHELTPIPRVDMLGDDGLLRGIAQEEMWLGIGIDEALVTVHPLQLLHDLQAMGARSSASG